MALEQMEGFELAGRNVSNHTIGLRYLFVDCILSFVLTPCTKRGRLDTLNKIPWTKQGVMNYLFHLYRLALYFVLGGNLNAASRQALMQKLARIEPASSKMTTT